METKMNMKLQDKLCEELERVSRKGSMTSSDVDTINKLVVAIEKLMKIEEMSGNEYSQGRYSRAYDERGNSYGYDNDTSEARHYVRGHYSRTGAADLTREHIQRMISEGNMSDSDRRMLERALDLV